MDVNKVKEEFTPNKIDEFSFTVEYREQSQMHVNTINGANLSSKGHRMMRNIVRSIRENEEIDYDDENGDN